MLHLWVNGLNCSTLEQATSTLTVGSIIDGMGNQTFLDPGTIAVNSSQGSTTILSGERRIVEFTGDTRLWDNYNHLVLLDASSNVVDMAWYATNYGPNISLLAQYQLQRCMVAIPLSYSWTTRTGSNGNNR